MNSILLELEQKICDVWESIQFYKTKIEDAEDDYLRKYYMSELNKRKKLYWSLIKKKEKFCRRKKYGRIN